jgi:hypothetical protein
LSILLYTGGNDVVITNNQTLNSGGIETMAYQHLDTVANYNNFISPLHNVVISNNIVSNENGGYLASIGVHCLKPPTSMLPIVGILVRGIEIRDNLIESRPPPAAHGFYDASFVRGEGYWNYVQASSYPLTPISSSSPIAILGTIFDGNQMNYGGYTYIDRGKSVTVGLFNVSSGVAQTGVLRSVNIGNGTPFVSDDHLSTDLQGSIGTVVSP